MARRDSRDLWEDNRSRLDFIKNNQINVVGSNNRLPEKAFEDISRKVNIRENLKGIHDNLLRTLVDRYKLAGDEFDYDHGKDNSENKEKFVITSEDYTPEIDLENNALIDIILEDKNFDETIEVYLERLKKENVNSLSQEGADEATGFIKILQEIVNFKILLYMLCQVNETETKYVKKGEFQLEEFALIMSGNSDLYMEPRNVEVIHKISTLFINTINHNKFYDLCNLYFNHLDEDLRMFNIRQEKVELEVRKKVRKTIQDENGKDIDIVEDLIETTERTLNIVSVSQQSKVCFNWSAGMHFEKILKDPWYYGYKPNTMNNILRKEHMGKKFIPVKREGEYGEKEFNNARQIKELYSEETIESGHTWEVTESIEYHQERKVKNNIRNCNGCIEIDINRSAKSLDKKLEANGLPQKAIWQHVRSKTAAVHKIDYLAPNDRERLLPVNVLNLEKTENILGLLGAGKSTFSMIAANDIIDRGGVVTFFVSDVEAALDLASQFEDIRANTVVLKGDSQSEKQMLAIMGNKLKNAENIFDLFEKERNSIRILDPTSQSKSEMSRVFGYEEEGRTSDTIVIREDRKKNFYINPEVKDSGIYSKLRDLKEAQVIIINYSAYTKTKIPASMDIFERDLFTAIHLISDVIFIDEVDLAQSKLTEEYISDVSIASSVGEGRFTNNYLEIMTPYVNKVNKDVVFLKTVWDQSQSASNLFNIQRNFNYWEILNTPFDIYGLIMDIFERYFKVDKRAIYRLEEFHKLERLAIKAQRIIPDIEPHLDYEKYFYRNIIEMREPIFDSRVKAKRIRKKLAEFINSFIKEEGLEPKKSLYIDPKLDEKELNENSDQEQMKMEVEDETFDKEKYINGEEISDAAFVRLLFFFEFCIFNKNQVYLNNETLGFLFRNEKKGEIPSGLGNMPIRPNPGIYPYAPKALVNNSHSYTMRREYDDEQTLNIKMKEYKLIGDRVLTESNTFFEGIESTPMPTIVMMSATSYIPTSSMYHNKHTPNYLIKNSQQADMEINCRFIPIMDGEKLASISGNTKEGKKKALKSMIRELTKEGGLFDQQLEKATLEYEKAKELYEENNPGKEYTGRKRVIGIPVTSFEHVYTIKEILNETRFGSKTIAQYRTGDEYKPEFVKYFKDANFDEYITKESVSELHKEDCEIFIFVMSSVGRGYNILQSEKSFESLIGSEFFLIRPYLTEENFADSIYALHSMHPRIIEQSKHKFDLNEYTPVSEIYKHIVGVTRATYNNLVSRRVGWKNLSYEERFAVASNYLVLLYQTIGRGLRGGTNLDVFFVDASFIGKETRDYILETGIGPNYSYTSLDTEDDSYLSIFETVANSEDFLIQELYSKLGKGLSGIAITKLTPEEIRAIREKKK